MYVNIFSSTCLINMRYRLNKLFGDNLANTVYSRPMNQICFTQWRLWILLKWKTLRVDIKLCHWVPKGSIFLKIDQNQLSFLFGFYLKKERKKIERKKVRARPLCHPRQPTHEPFRFIGHINASVP